MSNFAFAANKALVASKFPTQAELCNGVLFLASVTWIHYYYI